MSGRSPLAIATIACLVVGVGLTVPFHQTLPLLGGIAALFAFIACGVFWLANPRDLARGEDEQDLGREDGGA